VKHADIEDLTRYIPNQPQLACLAFFNGRDDQTSARTEVFESPLEFFLECEHKL
jgi:hypothetical protein